MEDLKKELVAALREKGLDVAEDTVLDVIEVLFAFIPRLILETENKFDDFILPFLPDIKNRLEMLADKIDGKEG